MLPIATDLGQLWPTDDEIRGILKKDPRASGTVGGTHLTIRFTHKQMVPTPVLLAAAPAHAAQAELRAHTPFASRSVVPSTATLPTQWQTGFNAEGDSLGWRVAYVETRKGQGRWWNGRSVRQMILQSPQ